MKRKTPLLAIVLISVLWGCHGYADTLSQLIAKVRTDIYDTSTNPQLRVFSDNTITSVLNDAQSEMQNIGWFVTNRTTFTLVSGTTEYAMPSDFQVTIRAELDGILLSEVMYSGLDKSANWNAAKGRPTKYYLNYTTTVYMGFNPVPNSATSTGTVTVDYVRKCADMVNLSDEPFDGWDIMVPYHYILAHYAAGRLSKVMGDSEVSDYEEAKFRFGLALANDQLKKRPGLSASGFMGASTTQK